MAGSPAVVSSLWIVDDLSTSFLMIKFYENLQNNSPVLALNEAQKWLRNLTSQEFAITVERFQPQIDSIFAQLPKKERLKAEASLAARKQKPYPFANPFYWAAFTAVGL